MDLFKLSDIKIAISLVAEHEKEVYKQFRVVRMRYQLNQLFQSLLDETTFTPDRSKITYSCSNR